MREKILKVTNTHTHRQTELLPELLAELKLNGEPNFWYQLLI